MHILYLMIKTVYLDLKIKINILKVSKLILLGFKSHDLHKMQID